MMKILAYTDKRFLMATMKVVGREADVFVSPPMDKWKFKAEWMQGYDLIYLDLHGERDARDLCVYGGSNPGWKIRALGIETVWRAFLKGAVVFATSCYLPETPFVKAFLDAGARAVIAGEGVNWGGKTRMMGAQLLAREILSRAGEGWEMPVGDYVSLAKDGLRKSWRRLMNREAVEDALAFEVYI